MKQGEGAAQEQLPGGGPVPGLDPGPHAGQLGRRDGGRAPGALEAEVEVVGAEAVLEKGLDELGDGPEGERREESAGGSVGEKMRLERRLACRGGPGGSAFTC